jgi:hypothetical protein
MTLPRRSNSNVQHSCSICFSCSRPRWTRDFAPDSEIPRRSASCCWVNPSNSVSTTSPGRDWRPRVRRSPPPRCNPAIAQWPQDRGRRRHPECSMTARIRIRHLKRRFCRSVHGRWSSLHYRLIPVSSSFNFNRLFRCLRRVFVPGSVLDDERIGKRTHKSAFFSSVGTHCFPKWSQTRRASVPLKLCPLKLLSRPVRRFTLRLVQCGSGGVERNQEGNEPTAKSAENTEKTQHTFLSRLCALCVLCG